MKHWLSALRQIFFFILIWGAIFGVIAALILKHRA